MKQSNGRPMSTFRVCTPVLWVTLLSIILLAPMSVHAATSLWTGGSGSWSDPSKWTPGAPGDRGDVVIGPLNPGYVRYDLLYGDLYNSLTIDNRSIIDILHASHTLKTKNETIGRTGSGTFIQSDGTHAISEHLYLGDESSGNGTYTLSDGALTAKNETIGFDGTGTFTQAGGTNNVSVDLYLGYTGSGNGTYTLNDGDLTTRNEYIGRSGTGTFTQAGGTNNVSVDLNLGSNGSGNGTYTLDDGALTAKNETIGPLCQNG